MNILPCSRGSLHRLVICAAILAVSVAAFAIPLSELIIQEDARLTAKVEAWQKQCADKPEWDDSCMKQRYELCGELGKFVALVNDEVVMLRGPVSPEASVADKERFDARLRHMEYLIDVAMHNMRCLGRSPSDPRCKAESAALAAEKAAGTAKRKTHP